MAAIATCFTVTARSPSVVSPQPVPQLRQCYQCLARRQAAVRGSPTL